MSSKSIEDKNLPIASTTDSARILNSEEFEVFENIPVFVEHTRELRTGRTLCFNRKELQQVVDRSNRRIDETGDFAPVVIGHTNADPLAPKPPKIGWAGPFRLGWLNKDKDKYAILADFRIEKDKVPLLKDYPRRSAEIWAEDKYEDMYLDPISLLGADTPWSDMGVLYHKQDSGVEKLCYCAVAPCVAQAPSGTNSYIPEQVKLSDPKKKNEKEKYAMFYGEGMDMMTDDQRNIAQAVASAILQSPEFSFLKQLMEAKKRQGEATNTTPLEATPTVQAGESLPATDESTASPVGGQVEPEGETDEDSEITPEDFMGGGADSGVETDATSPDVNAEPEEAPADDDSKPAEPVGESESEPPYISEDGDNVETPLDESGEEPAGDGLPESIFSADSTDDSPDSDEPYDDEDEDFEDDDLGDEVDEDDDLADDNNDYDKEDEMASTRADDFERRIHRLEVLLNASLKKSTTQERYSKLSDLRQKYLFDETAEREKCAYAKMTDEQFKNHCADIEANYRKNPNFIEVPSYLTGGAPQYSTDRPGSVQYSKDREQQIEAEVMKIAHRNAYKGVYQRAEDIREEVAKNFGNQQ